MTRIAFVFSALGALACLSTGCGGAREVTGAAGTQIDVDVTPSLAYAEEPTLLTVSASNAQSGIRSVTIDFTGDGTWDETREFDAASVTAAFEHVYATSGSFVVRVEARDGNDAPTVATLPLTVSSSRLVPVSYVMLGYSADGGICSAHGPPSECAGCSRTLGADLASAVRRPLGSLPHRSPVSITQAFSQWPYANGQDVLYSCQFSLRFVAGTAPNEIPFGLGTCTTSSVERPARLTCTITAASVVP